MRRIGFITWCLAPGAWSLTLMDRRRFLHTLGALSSATMLSSCGSERGQKTLISMLVPPEDGVIPGEARWVATTCTECPAGCGMQVRLREGRAVKLEGIPEHPISHGGLCMRGQAGLWRLYHPERIRTPLRRAEDGTFREIGWDEALSMIDDALKLSLAEGRRNLYLAGRTTGSLSDAIDLFCGERQVERLFEFEFFAHAALRQAYGAMLGISDIPHYRLGEADLLVSVGADILETFVSPVDFASQIARARENPRFYWLHLEPAFTLTGANAHKSLPLRPGSEAVLLSWLLRRLEGDRALPSEVAAAVAEIPSREVAEATGLSAEQLEAISGQLQGAERPLLLIGGLSLAHLGGGRAAALAVLLQWRLGMFGLTADFDRRENYASVGSALHMQQLSDELEEGGVGVLFVTRADPVGQIPDELGFAQRLSRASLRVGMGTLIDATAQQMDLVLPLSHALESWGDAVPRIGVRSLIRPAVAPLYATHAEGEILLTLAGDRNAENWRDYLFSRWRRELDEGGVEEFVARGFVEEDVEGEPLRTGPQGALQLLAQAGEVPPLQGMLLAITPSIRHFDGRSRPLPLLSEIPDPLTTISWGEWISVPASFAAPNRMRDRQLLRLSSGPWEGSFPAKSQPGLPEGVFAIQRSLLPGAPYRFDPASGEFILFLDELQVEKGARKQEVAILAGSTSQEGRGLIPDPDYHKRYERVSLYPELEYPEYRWAMAIDLARCIGCGACVAACYAENNVPITGLKNHLRGREMSWLRIEPWYDASGGVEFLPMLCQHCGAAPCEPVCPVYAAYHNPEGLNIQVYNRCVGTRYCSNNCPYKVRRFNWWPAVWPEPAQQMLNPDLSVRTKGMMEKCTFCIQRIHSARDRAKDEGRPIQDGEVVTACAQSCPTGAIVFGNILDPESTVSRWAADERTYRVFESLGTQPSIYYLRKAGARSQEPEARS
jgi:Fe-S-cluster-containing dehydrogenase component